MRKILLALALLPMLQLAYGQGYYNKWYFGNGAGLDFNSGSPVPIGGSTNTVEGTAAFSDINGNLLFYTDGVTVWNANHVPMPNGTGLTGNGSSSQSALIVPDPAGGSLYYIFTSPVSGQFRYSQVDMNLAGGLGDVTAVKNIILHPNSVEKIAAVRMPNGTDFWVIGHEFNTDVFFAYQVTAAGVNTTPVISNVGSVNTNQIGWMKANHAGTKIVSAIRYMQTFELFDFDKSTGVLSNFVSFGTTFNYPYGVEFSPDDSKVYLCGGLNPNYIMQADMNAGSNAAIVASLTQIGTPATSAMGAIQLGPDCKIYAARYGTTQLGVINNPNAAGAACNYVDNQVTLTTGSCQLGLPNFFEMSCCQIPSFSLGPDTTICQGQTIMLSGDTAMAYLWSTGDTTQTITVSVGGTYWLEASNGPCSVTDTITVTVAAYPVVSLGPDTSICQGQALTLTGPAATTYLWSTGATVQAIGVSTSGTYWLQAANGSCASADTMLLTVIPMPVASLGPDTTLCQGQTLTLASGMASAYLWSTGETTATIAVTTAGTYWLQASNGPCTASDTIAVAFNAYPAVSLGPDTILCQGQSITLAAGAASAYAWSTGATTASISVAATGTYWVLASNGQCATGDTVAVTVNTYPVVSLGPDSTLCDGESLTLSGGAAGTYLWSTGATGAAIAATTTGTYWLLAGNDHCLSSDTVEVTFLAVPAPALGADTAICIDASLTLSGAAATSYLWSTGETTATITVHTAGTYWLVSNNAQCTGSDTIDVALEDCAIEIEMPNVFTPNGDGLNEIFLPIKYKGIEQASVRIFNRWGEEVFYSDDVLAGWNGQHKGTSCPAGTYFWIVRYTTRKDVTDVIQGYLSLIR